MNTLSVFALSAISLIKNSESTVICETAWAYFPNDNPVCFLDDGFANWGWRAGPIDASTIPTVTGYTIEGELWGGAVGCNIDTVGTYTADIDLTLFDDGSFTLEIIDTIGSNIEEVQLYIGTTEYPSTGVAPRRFPYNDEFNSPVTSATLSGSIADFDSNGSYYVMVHTAVCINQQGQRSLIGDRGL